MLRKEKVVGKFVEFFGEGTASLSVPDRATIGNMSPEYGATMGFFPVDQATVDYLAATGRTAAEIDAFASYFKAQGMFGIPRSGEIDYTKVRDARPRDGQAVASRARSARRIASSSPKPQEQVQRALQQADRRGRILQARRRARPSGSSRRSSRTGSGRSAMRRCRSKDGAAPRDVVEMVNNRPTPDPLRGTQRAARVDRQRRRADRRDHLVHQHVQSRRAARGRPARQESGRARPHRAPARQDVARARLAHGDRVPDQARASCRTSSSSASPWRHTAARRASATPATSRPRSTTRSSPTTSICAAVLSGNRNFEARIHPEPQGELPGLAAARRRVRDRRHGAASTSTTEPLGTRQGRQAGVPAATSGRRRTRSRRCRSTRAIREVYRRLYGNVADANPMWGKIAGSDGPGLRLADVDLHREAAVLRRLRDARPARRATSAARARSASSATRSPPTTSRPPARSRRTRPPASGWSSTA